METEIVRVCGIYYKVWFGIGAMGEREIITLSILGEDGLAASSRRFEEHWETMLATDHVDAIVMAVKDGNFVKTIKA